jgi:ABC-2 type transport system permease protein
MNYLLAVQTLWQREIVRFARQRNRIIGALGTPLLFWLILGSGLSGSFHSGALGGERYLEYFFPGALMLIVLFPSIFSTISIIEDRTIGFLQAVLVAPIPRSAITLGKILGGTTIALIQAFLFLLLAPTVGISLNILKITAMAGVLFLAGFSLTAFGFLIAWKMDSSQGFHAIINLLLVPMWLLSGAFFPATGAPPWMRAVILLNPMTYGVGAIRRILYWGTQSASAGIPSLWICLAASLAFGIAAFCATSMVASRPSLR